MMRWKIYLAAAVLLATLASGSTAQEFTALARLDGSVSRVTDTRRGLAVDLTLSQGVPYRVFTLDAPRRLVIDFRELDWSGASRDALMDSKRVSDLRFGLLRPGWSRLVVDLTEPLTLSSADLRTNIMGGPALLAVRLDPVSAAEFAERSGAPPDPKWDLPEPAKITPRMSGKTRGAKIMVILDPGHGGVDPGAERAGVVEKDLMLQFARELRDILLRSGEFDVALTREDDSFVSLERRVDLAHQFGAHVFLSLHADVVSEGEAHGAVVHVLADSASDAASEKLAERHNRSDILAGIDLRGRDDVVAGVLLDLARMETQPRTERLAESLVAGIREIGAPVNSRPVRSAAFSVLKAADIPSVLLEVGFLSSARDRSNLIDPAFRTKVAWGLRDALRAWAEADASRRMLLRR